MAVVAGMKKIEWLRRTDKSRTLKKEKRHGLSYRNSSFHVLWTEKSGNLLGADTSLETMSWNNGWRKVNKIIKLADNDRSETGLIRKGENLFSTGDTEVRIWPIVYHILIFLPHLQISTLSFLFHSSFSYVDPFHTSPLFHKQIFPCLPPFCYAFWFSKMIYCIQHPDFSPFS